MRDKNKKILIFGNFSGSNAGDTVVLYNNLMILKKAFNKITVYIPTSNTDFIKGYFIGLDKDITVIPIDTRLSRASLRFLNVRVLFVSTRVDIIITTAGILFDRNLSKLYYSFILTMYPVLVFAKIFRTKIIGLNVGVYSSGSKHGGRILARVIKLHNYIFARDKASYDLAYKIKKGSKVFLTTDSALASYQYHKEQKNITIGINLTKYLNISNENSEVSKVDLISILDSSLEKIAFDCIKVITTSKMDSSINTFLIERLEKRYNCQYIDLTKMTPREINNEYKTIDVMIGMRMHSLIFALSYGIPIIGLNYDPKVRSFIKTMGIEDYIIDMNQISIKNITEAYKSIILNEKIKKTITSYSDDLVNKRDEIILSIIREL
jgi:polysaccharide pyruvyl transferase WcaK-like protein